MVRRAVTNAAFQREPPPFVAPHRPPTPQAVEFDAGAGTQKGWAPKGAAVATGAAAVEGVKPAAVVKPEPPKPRPSIDPPIPDVAPKAAPLRRDSALAARKRAEEEALERAARKPVVQGVPVAAEVCGDPAVPEAARARRRLCRSGDGMNAVVARETVEQIVVRRNRALTLFGAARDRLQEAYEALSEAYATVPGHMVSNAYNRDAEQRAAALLAPIKVPSVQDFQAAARFQVDRSAWSHLIGMTDLERLMDKSAKDELRQQLLTEPEEITIDNVYATLEQFMCDSGTIFRRGLANAFSNLDRRFRSHDGWKIGSRVILNHALNEYGWWSHHSNKRDTLQDIERAFFVLDGKTPPSDYAGIVGAVEKSREGNHGARQSEAQTDYFTARCWKNGNLHVWFKRDDLLDRVNRLLGEYYGAPIPEERAPDEDTGLHDPKTTLAKNHGWFPTPDAVAETVVNEAGLVRAYQDRGLPPLAVLEPSAGLGSLARRCVEAGAVVDCVEAHMDRAGALAGAKIYRRVIGADFLTVAPRGELYDRIVMNPPFDRERDIDHVLHALQFLKPNGRLVAIMSASTEFRETKKSVAFRALMTRKNALWRDLPAGSFSSVGTNCNTVILKVWNAGREHWS